MVEYQLLVRVAVHVLVVELTVEVLVDGEGGFAGRSPYVAEFGIGSGFVGGALLGEAFHTEDFGGGESCRPFADEDVVLVVGSSNIRNAVSQGFEFCADFRGESRGGEYGESAGMETDWVEGMLVWPFVLYSERDVRTNCPPAAHLEVAKPTKGRRAGYYVWRDIANHST